LLISNMIFSLFFRRNKLILFYEEINASSYAEHFSEIQKFDCNMRSLYLILKVLILEMQKSNT
jgi:hypothetical protein